MSAPSGPADLDDGGRGRGKRARMPDRTSRGNGHRSAGSPGSESPGERRSRVKAEELRLAVRASRGDVEAFSKLVRAHTDHVRKLALRALGSGEAEDAAQEVWIRVWANMKGFRGESAFGTWLHTIALNTCRDVRRRKMRREGREAGEETLPRLPEPAGGDGDPEASTLGSERRQRVRVALDGVRAEHRKVLLLRHVEDLSYADIAGLLEVPEGTAKGWGSRGRAAMLAALCREEPARDGAQRRPPNKPTEKTPEPSPNP